MATNECVKDTISLHLRAADLYMPDIALPTFVYKDNRKCYDWAKKTTTKGLKHLNLQENVVRECQQEDFSVQIKHISGNINCADIFTKELRNIAHFRTLRNSFMCSRKSFLQRQINFSQRTNPHSAPNHTVLPRLPASPPKQSVHKTPATPSLRLPHPLS